MRTCAYLCPYKEAHADIHTCIRVHVYTKPRIHVNVCAYTHTGMLLNICTSVHLCTHTFPRLFYIAAYIHIAAGGQSAEVTPALQLCLSCPCTYGPLQKLASTLTVPERVLAQMDRGFLQPLATPYYPYDNSSQARSTSCQHL